MIDFETMRETIDKQQVAEAIRALLAGQSVSPSTYFLPPARPEADGSELLSNRSSLDKNGTEFGGDVYNPPYTFLPPHPTDFVKPQTPHSTIEGDL